MNKSTLKLRIVEIFILIRYLFIVICIIIMIIVSVNFKDGVISTPKYHYNSINSRLFKSLSVVFTLTSNRINFSSPWSSNKYPWRRDLNTDFLVFFLFPCVLDNARKIALNLLNHWSNQGTLPWILLAMWISYRLIFCTIMAIDQCFFLINFVLLTPT